MFPAAKQNLIRIDICQLQLLFACNRSLIIICKMYLTVTERIEVLIMIGCGDRTRSQEEVCEMFNHKYPNKQISQATVSKVEKKFREHGHVNDLPKSGRNKVVNDENSLNVLLSVQENRHATSRTLGQQHGMSHSSVLKILRTHKYHPYEVQLIHELNEDDPDRRVQFCEQMLEMCNGNPMFLTNVIFSDESTFTMNGTVNRQNCRYWADVNPHWAMKAHTQYPQKVNVWAGIVGNRILGPYFFEGNLNGNTYLEFLQDELIPALAVVYPNEDDPDIPSAAIWFQQDGAPPHYTRNVRNYLDQMFPNQWIGRRGPIEWPARSPDLTPLDFFLWGYLK